MNRFSPLIVLFCFAAGLPAVFGAASSSMPSQQQIPAIEKKVGPSAESVYNEGVALMKNRNYAAARAKFEEAVKLKPSFAEAHNNLAFCLRKQNPANYKQSLDHYNTAIKLNPRLARAYEYRGVLLVQMNRKADAEKDLAALKQLDTKLAAQLETAIKTGKDTEY
jgi:tetratricopeptide (TPR) repeat protein